MIVFGFFVIFIVILFSNKEINQKIYQLYVHLFYGIQFEYLDVKFLTMNKNKESHKKLNKINNENIYFYYTDNLGVENEEYIFTRTQMRKKLNSVEFDDESSKDGVNILNLMTGLLIKHYNRKNSLNKFKNKNI